MIQTILELSASEAREFFLQASRFCTIDLPKYFDFQKVLTKLEQQIGELNLEDIRDKESDRPNDCENVNYKFLHYCPVKVDKAFFEIIEIQSTTVLFKGATI